MGRKRESADGKRLLDPNGPRLVFGVLCKPFKRMAGTTGLEPAASAVTGQRSNQLNYVPTLLILYHLRRFPCSARSPINSHFACAAVSWPVFALRIRAEGRFWSFGTGE